MIKSWPLTEPQEGIWFAQALDPGNAAWNCGQYIELTGPLDLEAFCRAHARAVAEADALSLRFDGGRQWLGDAPELVVHDWRDRKDARDGALAAIAADGARQVDLTQGPIAGFALYLIGPKQAIWAERIHHLATDGYAMVLFTNRVGALYGEETGILAGPPLAPLSRAVADDSDWRASPHRAGAAAFWAEELAGLEGIASPGGQAPAGADFHRARLSLSPDLRKALLSRAKTLRLGWPDVLTALCAAYLSRVSGEGERVFGLPYMARMGTQAARVPAMWMNILPWRARLDETAPLDDTLRGAAAHLAKLRRHGRYRSEAMRRDLRRSGAGGAIHGPLINLQPFDMPPTFPGLYADLHILGAGAVDDLNLTFRGDGAGALLLEVDTNPALYDAATTEAHADRLVDFLNRALMAERLTDVATLGPQEADWAVFGCNATDHVLPEVTLTDLIEAQMRDTPDAVAVEYGDTQVSYAELDRRSAALAGALVAQGAGPGRVVAVAMERSEHLAVALVAVLRAGAAYVPLDPDQPEARREALIARTGAVALLGKGGWSPEDWPSKPPTRPPHISLPRARPDDLAYILFTSGSTGEPKGVMIEHRAIVNRLLWMRDHYGFSADDRILQKTPTTFDVSVWELFLPYLCGARLVFAPPGAHRDPRKIAALIRRYAITTVHFVPSMLALFLQSPASGGIAVNRVFCSGEALPPTLRDTLHARMRASLHNLYGPTEAAVDVSFWEAGPTDQSDPLPIGWPVWNTRLYVLDTAMRPLPPGVPGQLFLGGVQLARGYIGRDDLTAERFLPDPFRPGRVYATGDIAMRRPDGAVVYLGRADHQVKIRGMRVEPGEIEAALCKAGAREAIVIAQGQGAGLRLLAYVIGGDPGAMRTRIEGVLPAHMLPHSITQLEEWPLTTSGKLDRKALPVPEAAPGNEAVQTPVEARIAALMREVLALPFDPGRTADFFALGGDSLAAVTLGLRLEQEFGRDPGIGQIFEAPTVAALARTIEGATGGGLAPMLDLGGDTGPPLFLIHPAGGLGWCYRALARALAPRRVVAVQAPIFASGDLPPTLTELAADHASRIAGATDGPVHLAGWSVGGILAQEIALQLAAKGREIGLLAALDAYPAECWRAEPEPDPVSALRALLAIAGHDPEAHPELTTRAAVVAFLRRGGSALGALPAPVLDAVVRLVTGTNRLIRAHEHRRYDGPMLHLRAGNDHAGRDLCAAHWTAHVGKLERIDLPFLHSQMVSAPAVAQIAPLLQERMG